MILEENPTDVYDPKNQLLCRFRHSTLGFKVPRTLSESRVDDHDALLAAGAAWLPLLDRLQDVLCWIKDGQGRFVAVNSVLAASLGLEKGAFVGKNDADIHTHEFASIYRQDDAAVMRQGQPMLDKPELINTAAGKLEWWSTSKIPLRDPSGRLIGTAGISRRMGSDTPAPDRHDAFATLIRYARENISRRLSVRDLGRHVNMSVATLERRIQSHFGITPRSFLYEIHMKQTGRQLKNKYLTIY